MRLHHFSANTLLAWLLVATTTAAAAQPVAPETPAQRSEISQQPGSAERPATAAPPPGLAYDERVWVTTRDGEPVEGRLRSWTGSTLEWNGPGGPVRTPLRDLQRVEVREPITDGAWKGALGGFAAGATLGLLVAVGLRCDRDCGPGYSRTRDTASVTLGFGAFSAAGGAALGMFTDMLLNRRRVVFERPSNAHLDVLPSVGQTVGGAVRLSW